MSDRDASRPAGDLSPAARVGALGLVGALVAWRSPQLLLRPRLWAEEGDTYFQYAYHVGLWDALFFLESFAAGYYLLVATLPSALTRFVPLEWVPAFYTYFSLGILLLPFAIILFGRSTVWDSGWRRMVACAIVLFCPAALGEVWLNVINAQIYLGLTALCILLEDLRAASIRRMAVYAAILAFAGLSGLYTAFLSLGFALKWWFDRSRGAAVALGVVAFTSAIQGLVLIHIARSGKLATSKLAGYDWVRSAAHTFYAQYVQPLLGRDLVYAVVDRVGFDYGTLVGSTTLGVALVGAAAIAGIAFGMFLLAPARLRSPGSLMIVCLGSLSLFTTLGAKNGVAGGRYAVLPGFTLLFLMLYNSRASAGALRWRAPLCGALLAVSLSIGAFGYRTDPAFECRAPCPSWPDEVAKWRADPTYKMEIWPVFTDKPGSRWVVHLVPGGPPPPPGTEQRPE